MDYPTSDSEARLADGKFTDGDVSASPVVPPSKNSAAYQNMVFDELLNVITAGGLEPSDQSVNQLITAINNVIASAIASKSNTGHGHSISDVSGLQAALNGKSNTGHGHSISEVSGLQTALNDKSTVLTGEVTIGANSESTIDLGRTVISVVPFFNSLGDIETGCGATWSGTTITIRNSSGGSHQLGFIAVVV
ncbi:phage tail fiber repeat family protein [Oceanobacter kriegii]|uniref:hypothetical protein n=1 Tax=Oceanobacter kriegii TaxID=64972 RepID=UPI0003FF6C0A|nr:hypothetical protein [Oceanobacter kriegii]